jgi:HSP20 family molecular chaperone IbpA
MSRMSLLSNPMLLGFEDIEKLIDRAGKSAGEGYPPYNIERRAPADGAAEVLCITLAIAGFSEDDLEISVDDKQLTIRGRQTEDDGRDYIYRGIAARQFQRTFVLADGIEVESADLNNGLLSINLTRHEPDRQVRKISIGAGK